MPLMVVGAGTVMSGEMARGVRAIEDTATRYTELGQKFIRVVSDDLLGRVYLQMAIGGERPPLSVMLRNLWFLLRTLPVAKIKARRYFETAAAQYRAFDMPSSLAYCLYSLGLLDKASKRPAKAGARFEEARKIADSVEATSLVRQIDAALADLPGA